MIRNSIPLASKMLFVQVLAASVRSSHGPHQFSPGIRQGEVRQPVPSAETATSTGPSYAPCAARRKSILAALS